MKRHHIYDAVDEAMAGHGMVIVLVVKDGKQIAYRATNRYPYADAMGGQELVSMEFAKLMIEGHAMQDADGRSSSGQ